MTTVICFNETLVADRTAVSNHNINYFFDAKKLHVDSSRRFAIAVAGSLPANEKHWQRLSSMVEQVLLDYFDKQVAGHVDIPKTIHGLCIAILTKHNRYAITDDGLLYIPHENEPILFGTGADHAVVGIAKGYSALELYELGRKLDPMTQTLKPDVVKAKQLLTWKAENVS